MEKSVNLCTIQCFVAHRVPDKMKSFKMKSFQIECIDAIYQLAKRLHLLLTHSLHQIHIHIGKEQCSTFWPE